MTDQYENMTIYELKARLHFFENHVEYLNKEIAKKDEQIAKLEEQNKEQKVEIDRLGELFKQALANLIGNAVLHSKEGTQIDISCDKDSVVIINFVAEKIDDIKSIREPFVKGSESRGNNGNGLGLAIVDNNLAMLRYKLELKIEGDKFFAIVKMQEK